MWDPLAVVGFIVVILIILGLVCACFCFRPYGGYGYNNCYRGPAAGAGAGPQGLRGGYGDVGRGGGWGGGCYNPCGKCNSDPCCCKKKKKKSKCKPKCYCFEASAATLRAAFPTYLYGATPVLPPVNPTFNVPSVGTTAFNAGTTLIQSTTPVVWNLAPKFNQGNGKQLIAACTSSGLTQFTQIQLCKSNWGGELTMQVSTTFAVDYVISGTGTALPVPDTRLVAQVVFIPECDPCSPSTPIIVGAPTLVDDAYFPIGVVSTGAPIVHHTAFTMTPVTFRTCFAGRFEVRVGIITNDGGFTSGLPGTFGDLTFSAAYLVDQGEFTVQSQGNPCPTKYTPPKKDCDSCDDGDCGKDDCGKCGKSSECDSCGKDDCDDDDCGSSKCDKGCGKCGKSNCNGGCGGGWGGGCCNVCYKDPCCCGGGGWYGQGFQGGYYGGPVSCGYCGGGGCGRCCGGGGW